MEGWLEIVAELRVQQEVEMGTHPHEPEPGSSWTGYAAIKYTAIVVIVLAILGFLAWYVIPALGGD